MIHEENTIEIMSVKESVHPDTKLESFTSHLQRSRPCCIRSTTLAFGSSLYILIQHGRSCCNSTYMDCCIPCSIQIFPFIYLDSAMVASSTLEAVQGSLKKIKQYKNITQNGTHQL